MAIIDVHTHTHFSGQLEDTSGIPDTREQYLKELRESNVVNSVIHVGMNEKPTVDLKPYGAIHCAAMSPKVNYKTVEDGLKDGTYQCIKIYLGYVHKYASDVLYQPAYKLAEKYDIPVVFHTGDIYTSKGKLKYADPMTVDEVAVDFPKVRFVIAHCGNPWYQTAAEVAYKNPNVYLECSAFLIGDLSKKGPGVVEKIMVEPIRWVFDYQENPSKMMFGTDWPLVGIKDYLEAYKRAIPKEHWKAVFHDNAARVFKFKPRTQAP